MSLVYHHRLRRRRRLLLDLVVVLVLGVSPGGMTVRCDPVTLVLGISVTAVLRPPGSDRSHSDKSGFRTRVIWRLNIKWWDSHRDNSLGRDALQITGESMASLLLDLVVVLVLGVSPGGMTVRCDPVTVPSS